MDPKTNNVEPPTEQTQVEAPKPTESSAGFAAGFNKVLHGTEPAVVEEPKPEPQPEPEPPKATEQTPPPATVFGLTEDQFRNELNRLAHLENNLRLLSQDLNGKYGRLNQVMQTLQQSTPAGEPVELTADDLAALKGEYPELAGIVAKDLNAALKKAGMRGTAPAVQVQQQGINQEDFDRLVNERVQHVAIDLQNTFDQKLDIARLDFQHPDRFEVQESPEWGKWLQHKGDQYKQELETTWDLHKVNAGLHEFKKWRDEQAKSQKRVENAVQPTNGASAAVTEVPNPSASFAKGFYKVLPKGSAH